MRRWIIAYLMGIFFVMITFGYTSPTYDDVNITFSPTYTPPTYDSVNITFTVEGGDTSFTIAMNTTTSDNNTIVDRNWVYYEAYSDETISGCNLTLGGTVYSATVDGTRCYYNVTHLPNGNYTDIVISGWDSSNNINSTSTYWTYVEYNPTIDNETIIISSDAWYTFYDGYVVTGLVTVGSVYLDVDGEYAFNVDTDQGTCNVSLVTLTDTYIMFNERCTNTTTWAYHKVGMFSGTVEVKVDGEVNQTESSDGGYSLFNFTGNFSESHQLEFNETASANLSYGVNPDITLKFECNLNTGTTNSTPIGQNDTYASVWCSNDGGTEGDIIVKLSSSLPEGWHLYACGNSTRDDRTELTTSYQEIYSNLASETNETNCLWLWSSCDIGAGSPMSSQILVGIQ